MTPQFHETFARSEQRAFGGQPLRLTDEGIWLALPLDVIQPALDKLEAIGFWAPLGPRPKVLDAGMGDGRLVAACCSLPHELLSYGIESNGDLCELAQSNLRALSGSGLAPRWRVCQGDYFDVSTYPKLGILVTDIDVFFNYPDGNEQQLAAFLQDHARPGSFLVVLTAEGGLALDTLPLEEDLAVSRGPGRPEFRLLVYRVQRRSGEDIGAL